MKLYKGDCLVEMAKIKNQSVDMVLADIPYGTTACKWDSVLPLPEMWENLKRVIKPNGAIVLTASQPFTTTLIASNKKMFKYEWIWLKSHSSGFQYAKYRPLQKHESIIVFGNGKITYNPQMMIGKTVKKRIGKNVYKKRNPITVVGSGVKNDLSLIDSNTYYPVTYLDFQCVSRNKSLHPTQKPVALMEYLIKTYTNEGELVLDFTMGSGTTGVACINTNRDFIGIELNDYFEIAKKRIENAQKN